MFHFHTATAFQLLTRRLGRELSLSGTRVAAHPFEMQGGVSEEAKQRANRVQLTLYSHFHVASVGEFAAKWLNEVEKVRERETRQSTATHN
jgi:hypothetical protein